MEDWGCDVSNNGDGCPRPGADTEPGLAFTQAEERKSRTYPEFGQQGRCKLVVLALEVGGRWSTATQTFLRALGRGTSHSRAALAHALQRRWGQMLTVAANTAFSSSLLELPATAVPSAGALMPPLVDVVADARWTSRLLSSSSHPSWSGSQKKNNGLDVEDAGQPF